MTMIRVFATAVCVLLTVSFFLPITSIVLVSQSIARGASVPMQLLMSPPEAHMLNESLRQALFGFLNSFNTSCWFALGVLFLMVVFVSVIDIKLEQWNLQLADAAKISPKLVEHYTGGNYEKAFANCGAASRIVRPKAF